MGSTVEQDRSHLTQQVGYLGERGRFADETRSKSSTKLARLVVRHFLMKKLESFRSTRVSIKIIGIRNWQQLRDCLCSTMEKTNRWRMMFTASWTKRLISRFEAGC